MGPYGLISILGWPYFTGLALVVVGFGIELLRPRLRTQRLFLLLVGLVVVLFGTAPAIEPVARLTDSWLLAGFVQYVFVHGHVLNNFDARFSWPGSLSLGGALVGFTGQSSALGFIRWAPLVFELLYLFPLLAIARHCDVSRRAGWLGVALFYATNWIDQDYFSPQALNLLFYLVVIAAVLALWRPVPPSRSGRGLADRLGELGPQRWRGLGAVEVFDHATTVAVLGLLALIVLASSISHQLTPYALVLELGGCLLARRLGRPELVIVSLLLAVGWLSLGASNFWIGHLSVIFGSIGRFGQTFGTNLSQRITGSSSHQVVVDARILLVAVLFVLGALGSLQRRATTRVLEVLAIAPFVLLVLQGYGGEGLLRVVLYGLPFSSLLAASALLPLRRGPLRPLLHFVRRRSGRGPDWWRSHRRDALSLLAVIVVLGFALSTTFVRGGNDSYEAYSLGELDAVNYVYAHVEQDQVIGDVSAYLPIGQRDIGSIGVFTASSAATDPTPAHNQAQLLRHRPAWIILSTSQQRWGVLVAGYPSRWQASLEKALVSHGYVVVAHWPTASVLEANPAV